MTTDLVLSAASEMFMPIMEVRTAQMRHNALSLFVRDLMVKDRDYGTVPGAGDKPTLLKPGAEKLVTYFGLSPVFVAERVTENFGDDGSEPLFMYRYRCELYRNGVLLGSGIGSCNSRESKYRYRNGERICPQCGKPAITRSKYPPRNNPNAEPGWYCYAKKGGCGAEFGVADKRITDQTVGKVINPDVADLVNTIDKMAQKRALIAATLITVNASDFFTQDIEDYIDTEFTVSQPAPMRQNGGAQHTESNGAGMAATVASKPATPAPSISAEAMSRFHAVGAKLYGNNWDTKRHEIVHTLTGGRTESSKGLTQAEFARMLGGMESRLEAKIEAERQAAEIVADVMAGEEMAH